MSNQTPIKAIRAKCLECSGFQPKEVRECQIDTCPLFPFRMGKNPNRAGIGNLKGGFSPKTRTQEGVLDEAEIK